MNGTKKNTGWQKCIIWEYFKYNLVSNKSTCQVETTEAVKTENHSDDVRPDEDSSQKIGNRTSTTVWCNKELAGKNPTNLKNHLKKFHPSIINWKKLKKRKVQC